jgi:hypothetical protein
MGAIGVNQNSRIIVTIIGISTDVISFVNHDTRKSCLAQPLGRNKTRKTSTYDEKIDLGTITHAFIK